MKVTLALLSFTLAAGTACKKTEPTSAAGSANQTTQAAAPAVAPSPPPLDPKNIVSIAMASPDHTTLVAAVKAAEYVTAIANPGPLTVFAPTNAAFAKLPPGTVDGLLQPGRIDDLKNVLKYHAATSVHDVTTLKDGQLLAMSNGAKVQIHLKDGQLTVNDAHVLASIRASNGIVHVIDAVLLPPAP
jgi:uncharacterized surface protein with fasciclin (FAS1) repeats